MKKLVALLSILSLAFLASCGNTESEVEMVDENQSVEVELEVSNEVESNEEDAEIESNEENTEVELDVEIVM